MDSFHGKEQGRRVSEPRTRDLLQGSHALSRYGDRVLANHDLTLGITLSKPAFLLGLHRFEPVNGTRSLVPWAMLLTRQGTSLP